MFSTRAPALLCLLVASVALAQGIQPSTSEPANRTAWTPPPRIVMPQVGRVAGRNSALELTSVRCDIAIRDAIATTTLEISLVNHVAANQEAILLVPVPAGAAVTGFTFEGPASESTAKILTIDEARREYDAIVARERDPALLEWAGWNLLRSSVFPVPPRGTQRVQIVFEQLLASVGDRIDYVLPRSDTARGPAWSINVDVSSTTSLAAVYSPTHELRTIRRDEHSASLKASDSGRAATGALRLSIVRGMGVTSSVLTYPDPTIGGGYFLLLAAAPPAVTDASMLRDVVMVIDRSGSMSGTPLEQAKLAAIRLLDSMRDGERLNIIDFSNSVSRLAEQPLTLDATTRELARTYLARLVPSGGTNMHDALLEALRQTIAPGTLPLFLFLTDGLPTIGRTLERDIRLMAEQANQGQRRIFTVGIGPDVNVPLLDHIADASRALATYVPREGDIGVTIGDITQRLTGPVLTDLTLTAGEAGGPTPGRVAEVLPEHLPDLFTTSTLVVLGQYRGEAPFSITIGGSSREGQRRIVATVDPRTASTAHAFVPRLWASRRIAQLIDGVRQLGATESTSAMNHDPRVRELVSEIVRLSATWGILTEYTSMLALEGSQFRDWRSLEAACSEALHGRAVTTRSGYDAVNQGVNFNRQKVEANVAATKGYIDATLSQVESSALAQCGDKNLWRQGHRWVDGELAGVEAPAIDESIDFGSERHRVLLWELVEDQRQAAIALEGEVLLRHRGKTYLVRNTTP